MGGKIRTTKNSIVFEITGFDDIFSIKRIIRIPLRHVVSVSSSSVRWFKPFPYVKIGGTSLPGIIRDGRFVTSKGWIFYVMHDPSRCITVNLNHEVYKKVIFEVEDKGAAISVINRALRHGSGARRKARALNHRHLFIE
ncbi:MAG: hypothetical protein ACREBH_02495 [Candidatus Micrarchaeaceae archaeon]